MGKWDQIADLAIRNSVTKLHLGPSLNNEESCVNCLDHDCMVQNLNRCSNTRPLKSQLIKGKTLT